MRPAQTVISTVGTSLFIPNLKGLSAADPDPARRRLAAAYAARDWDGVAGALAALLGTDRLCGAEINSLASLRARGLIDPAANLAFGHSATADGRAIAQILVRYYRRAGHPVVEAHEVADLQDDDPRRFRTHGLRNLAKVLCKIIRDRGPGACALNATGGYKAQVAIAVLIGQALGVPVYYKHERFDEVIAFPPMPVALDFLAWMRLSGLLSLLAREGVAPEALGDVAPDDATVLEGLVERVTIDGRAYVELSATGQVFHETFRARFHVARAALLPPAVPAARKEAPKLTDHAVTNRLRAALERFLAALTAEVPQVRRCATTYCNPDLPEPTGFRLRGDRIEGTYGDGTAAVRFDVETSAETEAQRAAVLAALGEWLEARS